MKLILCMILLSASSALADPLLNVVTNHTPEIAVPSGWVYQSPPGTFFWNGFQFGAVVAAFAWGLTALRSAVGGAREEL